MNKAIEIQDLSKIYDLGLVGTGTLSRDINRSWAKLRGKPDPYATLAELNDRTQKSESNMVYALKDINFSVDKGDILGVIGKNGAGKSTLLKILSQITSPTTGTIKMKGRVASLLEVGTGMHPEMTARQNIYLNGSLMGMRRFEITKKLDEIVNFAGIEKYIDTPIKRFSSGMTVRLGFAIAAFLEPEILIVDEVLAVGDYEFQKKAIGKMQDVSSSEGRTVIFVSHNMASVEFLCNKGIVMTNGCISLKNVSAKEAIDFYTKSEVNRIQKATENSLPKNELIQLLDVNIRPLNGEELNINSGFIIAYNFFNHKENINLGTTLEIMSVNNEILFHQGHKVAFDKNKSRKGIYHVEFHFEPYTFNADTYKLNLIFGENRAHLLMKASEVALFDLKFRPNEISSRKLPGKFLLRKNSKSHFVDKIVKN